MGLYVWYIVSKVDAAVIIKGPLVEDPQVG